VKEQCCAIKYSDRGIKRLEFRHFTDVMVTKYSAEISAIQSNNFAVKELSLLVSEAERQPAQRGEQ